MKVPCKLCIAYAACKCKEVIECDKLYNYIKKTSRFPQRILPNTCEIGGAQGVVFYTNRKPDYGWGLRRLK
jgi:hypothetical protein